MGDKVFAQIPPGGYVISAHGEMSNKIAKLKEGDFVEMLISPSNNLVLEARKTEEQIEMFRAFIDDSFFRMERLAYEPLYFTVDVQESKLANVKKLIKENKEEEAEQLLAEVKESLYDLQPSLYESLEVETRGIWVDNFTIDHFYTRNDIVELLDKLKRININVIYPDVYCYGEAIFPSKNVPQKSHFKNNFTDGDVLAILIEEAHKRNIEVHPMVRIFALQKGIDHFIETDRVQWLDKTKNNSYTNEDGNYWLCPALPEVRAYNLALLNELVTNYDIDGVHLDYIRSETNFGYNSYMRELFQKEHGLDPIEINDEQTLQKFKSFKEDFVTIFVEQVFFELKAIKPKIIISAAAAAPYGWGLRDLGQNSLKWAQNRQIHYLTPMCYRKTAEDFSPLLDSELIRMRNLTYIYPGLGLYLFDECVAVKQIEACRNTQLTGESLFSTSHLKSEYCWFLENGPWRLPAKPTFRDPLKAAQVILKDIIGRIEEFEPFFDDNHVTVLQEYVERLQEFSSRIDALQLRAWDTRDIREANQEEEIQLQPMVTDLQRFSAQINRNARKDKSIPIPTAERLVSDINKVHALLMPLLHTSKEFAK